MSSRRFPGEPTAVPASSWRSPTPVRQRHQTRETFSVNWETDVRITCEALLKPLRPGSRVVVISSGAALNSNGSPLSGGYAGAKTTQRFITGCAQDESVRAGLGITFATVLPQFAPVSPLRSSSARSRTQC